MQLFCLVSQLHEIADSNDVRNDFANENFNKLIEMSRRILYPSPDLPITKSFGLTKESPPFEPKTYKNLTNLTFVQDLQRFCTKNYINALLTILHERLNLLPFDELIIVRFRFNFDIFSSLNQIFMQAFDKVIIEKIDVNPVETIGMLSLCEKKHEQLIQSYLKQKLDSLDKPDWVSFFLSSKFILPMLWCHLKSLREKKGIHLIESKYEEVFLKKFNDTILSTVKKTILGEEKIGSIKLLNGNVSRVSELIGLAVENKLCDRETQDSFTHLLQLRIKEIEAFSSYRNSISAFVQFSASFKSLVLSEWQSSLKHTSRIDDLRLNEVCQVSKVKKQEVFSYSPKITFFTQINSNEIKKINDTINLDRLKCILFDEYFEEACKQVMEGTGITALNEDLVLHQVQPLVFAKWRAMATSIEQDKLKLIRINEILSNSFDGNYKKLSAELIYICKYHKIRDLDEKIQQIKRYGRFRTSIEAANLAETIRIGSNLTKKFKEIEDLLNVGSEVFKEWTLSRMDRKIETSIEGLVKLSSEERIECLSAFSKSNHLIDWLRQNTKDLKELKILVDLVSITRPSETSSNKDLLAKTLKEAGTAFAPLIYNLKPDSSFTDFIRLCDIVWENLKNNTKIAAKLVAVKDDITTLENIKKKRGNVELSSINQAKQFNEKGVYQIGLKGDGSVTSGIELEIELEVERIIGNDAVVKKDKVRKIYNFAKLKELQSVLMLVAKKGENEEDDSRTLEYFNEVFNMTIRLSDILVKLSSSGCSLFDRFNIKLFCDVEGKRVRGMSGTLHADLEGMAVNNIQDDTLDAAKKMNTFMESCYDVWQSHLASVRAKYHSINYFTVAQIIQLRNSIAKLVFNRDESMWITTTTLLHVLNNSLTPKSLVDAFRQSKPIYSDALANNKSINQENAESVISEIARSNNFKESLVRKAVDMLGLKSLEKIVDFCVRNDGFNEDEEEEVSRADFQQTLQHIWKMFVKKQNSPSEAFVNIEQLAVLLELLDEKRNLVNRRAPGYLTNRGAPNLIICKPHEQMSVALSIYAESFDQPLPESDEALFCNTQTSAEEVENFFRVAFKSSGKRIFLLLNIQELSYSSASRVEKFLNANANASPDYVLVCIACHSQCLLASALFKFKVCYL